MSSDSSSDRRFGSHASDSSDSADGGHRPDSARFQAKLAGILEQILSASEDRTSSTPDPCTPELVAVARKYPALDFCYDPILLEMVEVLTQRIQGLSEHRLLTLKHAVAASLFEDQVSLGRLQHLWQQLRELVTNDQ